MTKKEEIIQLVTAQKLLPLYYHQSETVSIKVLKALYSAGIKAVEYTNRGESALDNFMAMRKLVNTEMPGMQLGIGTIKTVTDAEQFIAAGADFIVCPIINPAVGKLVHKAGLLWIPGCMTTTEIHLAESSDATLIKIFPGNILSPSYIVAIKELFPGLSFMVTGGVEANVENLKAWFSSGVKIVGMGSKLISKTILEQKNYEEITSATTAVLAMIKGVDP